MPTIDRLGRIYNQAKENNLLQDGYTEERFREEMKTEEGRKGFYDFMSNIGALEEDYPTFSALVSSPEMAREEVLAKMKEFNETEPYSILGNTPEQEPIEIDWTQGLNTDGESTLRKAPNEFLNIKVDELRAKGEDIRNQRIAEYEEAFANRGAMSQMNYGRDMQELKNADPFSFLDENDTKYLGRVYDEVGRRRYENNYDGLKEDIKSRLDDLQEMRSATEDPTLESNTAAYLYQKAIDIMNIPSKFGNTSGLENFNSTFWNNLFDRQFFGVTDLNQNKAVENIVTKLNNNEELMPKEIALIDAFMSVQEAMEARAKDMPLGAKIGEGAAKSAPFMVDMILTEGLTGVGKRMFIRSLANSAKAANIAGDAAKAERLIAKAETWGRRLGGSEGITIRSAEDASRTFGALKQGEKVGARGVGQYVAREAIETPLQTAIMPSSWNIVEQDKINKEMKGEDFTMADFARSFGNAYVETLTERAGGKFIDWGLGKIGAALGATRATFAKQTPWVQMFTHKAGSGVTGNSIIQSPIGETGEEYLGALINYTRANIADRFGWYSAEENEQMREEARYMFTKEGFLQTFGTVLPMSLGGGALNIAHVAYAGHNYNGARQRISELLIQAGATKEQAEDVMHTMDVCQSEEEFADKCITLRENLNALLKNDPRIADAVSTYKAATFNYKLTVNDFYEDYLALTPEQRAQADKDFKDMKKTMTKNTIIGAVGKEMEGRVNEDNKMVYEVTDANGRHGFVKKGHVDVFEDKDGVSRISPERSEQLTIQWDGASNLEQVGAGSVTLVSSPVDMETYADNIATARANQASSEDMFEVGDAVYAVVNGEVVPDVQPSQVVSVDENGVTITTAEGVVQTLSHEQAQEGLLSGRELESRRQQKEMQDQLEKMKNGADPFVGVYLDKNDIEHTITKDEEGKYILDGANAIGDDKHMNDMRSGLTSLGVYLKESAKPFQESAAPSQKTTPAQDYVAQHGENAAEQVATDITALESQLAAAEEELAAAQEAMVGAPSDALLDEDEDLANEWAGKKDALAAARIKVEKKKLSLDKYKGIQAAIADGSVEVSNEQQTAAQIAQENVGKPQKTVREMQQEITLRTTLDKLQQLIGVEVVQVESLADVKNEDALREIHRDHEVKGWYDDAEKKAYLYMPNVRSVQDAVETIFHESVAHKGIREVLGETFKDYCHDVFDGMMPHLQKYFSEYAYNTMSVEKQKAIAGDTAKASFRDLNAEQRKAVLASDHIKEVAADEYMANVAEECARKFLENPDVAVRESETSMLLERFVNRVRGWLGIDYTPNVTKRDIVRMITASRLGDKREYFVQKQAEQLASKEPQVVTNEVGEVVATTDGKGHTGLSVKNYDDCRGMLVKYLDEEVKNGNITAADRYAMLKELNDVYETAKALADGDPKSLFGQWSYEDIKTIADIVDKYGDPVPVMHAIKSNAEYALNIDFSTVCKKRMEIDRIMNKLIADGTLTNEKLSPQDIARINQIIQSHGLEIACEICFVDSRRYNAYTFAEGFNHKFNHLVASLAGYEMPFVKGKGNESKKRVDERTAKLADAAKHLAGYNYSGNKLFDEENKDRRDLSKETNETFSIAKAILAKDKKAAIRGYKLNWGGIYDCLNPLLNKARKVMAEPTFKADFAAYCKEAGIEKPTAEDKASYAFSQVPSNQRNAQQKMALAIAALPHLRKLTKSEDFVASTGWVNIMQNNKELETLWNIQKGAAGAKPNMGNVQYQGDVLKKQVNGDIFDIAGYRMQSFSDFIGRMWFDYMQAFADLSAKRLPGHAYTKEPNFVKLFGLMGMKINMSLVFAVDTKNKVPAGLTLDKNGNLTYYFHRTEKDEKTGAIITQGQTFPPEDAFILQDEPEYTKNCGTIAVGLSDEHILMMLKDPNIRMVIPYHKSGLPHGVALIYNMNEITDYTDVQSTKANILDKGKYSTEQKKKINNTMHKRVDQFNFMLHQLSIAEDKVAAYNALRLLFVEGDASKVDMHDEYKRIYNGIVNGEITEGLKKVEPSEKAADKGFLPKLAANIYLEACEKYDYSPKFCGFETKDNEGNIIKHADLTKDENYYKVLIDFAVYDAQGNYTPQEVIKFNTPENLVELVKGAMAEDEDFNAKGNEVLDAVCGDIGGFLSNDAIRKEQDRIAALKDEQITPQQRLFMGGGLKEMNKYQYNVGDGRNVPTDAKMTAEIVGYNMEKKQPDETSVQYAKRRSSKDPKTLLRIESLGVPYTGSKSKVAIPIVSQLPGGKRFVDLFCGGGAVTHAALLSGKYESVLMNDNNPIGQQLFLDGIDGKCADYNKTIGREEFKDIARTPESLLWSYASNSSSYQGDRAKSRAERVNALQALAPMRKFISTEQMDYRDVVLKPGDVIYADIPYKGTDTSAYGAEPFDYDAFYAWALDQDVPVYVSEYSMPDGFTEVWSEEVNKLKGGNITERLFVQSKFANDDNTRGREAFKTAASESFFKARNNEMSVDELLDEVEDINNKTINNEGVADAVERVRDAWSEQDMDFIDNAEDAVNELEKGVFSALDGETRMREVVRYDRNSHSIGDGSWHETYNVLDLGEDIETRVDKSSTTESVYVTYTNKKNGKSAKVRFSGHMSNSDKYGDTLVGFGFYKNELMYRLGLADRKFIPKKYVPSRSVSPKKIGEYEVIDGVDMASLYQLPIGADISKYVGKVVRGGENNYYEITGDKVGAYDNGTYEYYDLNGNKLNNRTTTRFRITPAEDAAYLNAVERGDMETAKKMVMEAAKKAMPNTKVVDDNGYPKVVYHGSSNPFLNRIDHGYFADDEMAVSSWAYEGAGYEQEDWNGGNFYPESSVYGCFLNIERPLILDFNGENYEEFEYDGRKGTDSILDYAKESGKYDGCIFLNVAGDITNEEKTVNEYIPFKSSQIKKADTITYRDEYVTNEETGLYEKIRHEEYSSSNVIPLSERFNESNADIRFRVGDGVIPTENVDKGVNIAKEGKRSFVDEIISGKKIVETRNTPSLRSLVGKRVALIETEKGKPASVRAYADIVEEIEYKSAKEFYADKKRHGINATSEYKWNKGQGVKYGYVLDNVVMEENRYEPVSRGNVIRNSDGVRFRTTWHGSAADFDKFDRAFSGTGKGQAVMGDGIYVAEKKGVAEYYATTSAQMKRHIVKDGGYYVDGEKDNSGFAPAVLDAIENSGSMDAAIKDLEEKIGLWKGRIGLLGKPLDTTKMEARLAWMKEHKDSNVEYQEEVVEMPTRNLYQVEIPDDNGKNYLNWDGKVSAKVVNDCRTLLERELDAESPGWLDNNKDILDDQWKYVTKNYVGATLYDTMRSFLVNKSASDILQELGFVGIKGEASHNSQNYVIFDANNAKIVDHTRFRIDPQSIVDEAGEEQEERWKKATDKWWKENEEQWVSQELSEDELRSNLAVLDNWKSTALRSATIHYNKVHKGEDIRYNFSKAYWNARNYLYYDEIKDLIKKELERRGLNGYEAHPNFIAELGLSSRNSYSVRDVRSWFDKYNTDKESSALFDLIMPVLLEIEKNGFSAKLKNPSRKGCSGMWSITSRELCLRPSYFAGEGTADDFTTTILHECIHACTSYALWVNDIQESHRYKSYINDNISIAQGKMPKELRDAAKELVTLFDTIRYNDEIRDMYGATNAHEMVAELSNPKFREALKKQNLLQKIIDGIYRFINKVSAYFNGEEYVEVNAYDVAYRCLVKMIENYDENTNTRQNHINELNFGGTFDKIDYVDSGSTRFRVATMGSYFSGGGLVECGVRGLVDSQFGVEFDNDIVGVYRDNHGDHVINADVRDPNVLSEIIKRTNGSLDYFHASPVCHNYSNAKNKADRVETELDIETAKATAKLIREVKPRIVTVENAPAYKDNNAVQQIISALNESGYTFDYGVYNSKDFGGVMNRDRFILRAVLDGSLPAIERVDGKRCWMDAVEDILPTLKKGELAEWQKERLKKMGVDYENVKEPLLVYGGSNNANYIPMAYASELAPSINTKEGGSRIIMPNGDVLMCTPRFFARLMGLPDSYELPSSVTLGYKVIGNGVPVNLTEGIIRHLLEENGYDTNEDADELLNEERSTRFRIRTKPEPKEKGIGYKVFYQKNGKLYPPMVANPNGEDTPVGVWLDADAAPIAGTSKTGRLQVKNGGKGTQGGSGTLSYRPGWHLGEIPYALQFNRKDDNGDKTLFPKDFVWAEVEYARDNDYQEEAMSYGYNKNGKFQHPYAGLPRVPEDGFYMYRTNPNPQTDPWIITGAMRVKKVLTKDEVDELVRRAGREPQRVEGDVRFRVAPTLDENEELYNYEERMREFRAKYGEEMADKFEEVADIDTKHLTGKQLADLIMLMGKMHSDSMDSIRDAQQKVSKRISAVNERIFLQGMVDRGAVEELVQLAKMFIKSGWADEAGKRDIAYIVSSIQKASRRASSAELEDAVNTLVDAMVHANVKKMASIMHDMMHIDARKSSAGVPKAGSLGLRQMEFIKAFNKYIGIDSALFPNRITELNDALAQHSERIARFEELDGKETLTKEEEDDKKRLDKTIENDYIQYNRINDEIISIELADAYKTGVVTNEEEVKKISNNLAVYRKALEYLPRINEADAIKTELLAEQERLEHILADETTEGREKAAATARLRGVENRLKGLAKLNEIYAAKDEDAKAVKNTLFSLINTEKTAYRSVAMNLIDGYVGVSSKLSGIRKEGKESYADWLQQERDRKERIRHYWRSDRKGQPYLTEELRPLRGFAKDADKLLQFMESPVKSFLYMLKDFSVNAPEGKGYLYNHFCYGLMEAEDKYWNRKVAAMDMLDKKATELFGKKRKVVDSVRKRTFIEVMNNESQTNIKFTIKEGENDKQVNYTAGQLMYLYQVNKMVDGREKLEAMGWTEENVAAATKALKEANENFIALADYIQQEFLPTLRKEYEKTFERMFGTAMPYIENYVPLQISDVAIDEVVDLNDKNGGALPSTVTKNLISRVRNTKPIALESVDMLELILSHVNTMEHWNAFAEVTRDLNTLLSDRAFKNSIKAGLGNTRHNYDDFENVCKLAVGCYEPSKEDGLSAIIKKVGGAKVAFRWFTALKQLLSFPAFMDNIFEGWFILYSVKNLVGSVKWGKENLPSLNKRWESRFAGDENLDLAAGQKNEFVKGVFKPWVWLQNHIMRHAMIANSGIDLITCAWGARSVYDAKRAKYIHRGYSVEEAERRAKLDAEIAFNETQQSSEGMFLSALQKDRDFISRSISLFNNSSFAYGRKFFEGIRESWRSTVHAKERYEFRKKQLMRDGLTEEKAEKFAKIDEAQAIAKGVLDTAIFGWVIQTCWNIGGSAYALLFSIISGDDEKKKRIIDEAAIDALIQPVRGLPLGASSESIFKSYISTQLDKADLRKLAEEKHWSKKKLEKMEKQIYSTVPSDRNAFLKYIGQNVHPAADELAKLAEIILDDDENADALKAADTSIRFFSQFFMGVDVGTLYNVYYGFADMVARYDDITWVDVYQDLGYVLNAPPSQVKYVGFYPRPGESAIDYRNRYVRMKILQKYGTMTPWVGEDVEKEMNKKYKKKAREERNKNKR